MDYESQDALEFIGITIHEIQSDLEYKKEEAERKGWFPDGKKYQSIIEMDRHMVSLKRVRTILSGKDESE